MYVFDTSSFVVIGHYFPPRFPSFWNRFNTAVDSGRVVSVREVYNELTYQGTSDRLNTWIKAHRKIFGKPSNAETEFVTTIFQVPHFQALVARKSIFKGTPVADPFVVAAARVFDGCVVTEEKLKKDAAKIPNVCNHFGIECTDVEGFMEREEWRF